MTLDELLQLQALRVKAGYDTAAVVDGLIEQSGEDQGVRQLCAKVSADLYAHVDQVCSVLDLSKRRFVEAAVIEALNRAYAVMTTVGVADRLEGDA